MLFTSFYLFLKMTFQEYCVLNFFKNTDFGVKNSLHATLLLQ